MPLHIKTIALAIGIQLIASIGIFFVFGWVLSRIQSLTQAQYQRAVGWKGILWTAWIGTPVHELSHVIFAWIFHHRIHRISLFRPNEETGGLGSVEHSFDKWSVWQRIGNFFVGAAPMIIGPMVLTALLYAFLPHARDIFLPLVETDHLSLPSILHGFKDTILHLFSNGQTHSWKFWIFVYTSFCVVCHMAPSSADLRGMFQGFVWVILLLIIANCITYALDINLTNYLSATTRYLHVFTSLYLYATLLSLVHLMFASTVFMLFRRT